MKAPIIIGNNLTTESVPSLIFQKKLRLNSKVLEDCMSTNSIQQHQLNSYIGTSKTQPCAIAFALKPKLSLRWFTTP